MGVLLLLLLWGSWRQAGLNRIRQQVHEEESGQRRFLATLATAAQDNQPLPPDPRPDTLSWLSTNVFKGGLDRQILTNSPTAGGAGAEVKLRHLTPQQVLHLLEKMTKVNLVVRRLMLSDLGSRSMWEVHLIVENPKPEGKP
jgi:hypothetical protein